MTEAQLNRTLTMKEELESANGSMSRSVAKDYKRIAKHLFTIVDVSLCLYCDLRTRLYRLILRSVPLVELMPTVLGLSSQKPFPGEVSSFACSFSKTQRKVTIN